MVTPAAILDRPLRCGMDIPVHRQIVVGTGVVVYIRGWAFSPAGRLAKLTLIAGNERFPVDNHSWVRRDVFDVSFPSTDPQGHSLFSEFLIVLPVAAVAEEQIQELRLEATLRDGSRLAPVKLGELTLIPNLPFERTEVSWPAQGHRIAICMATFNPLEKSFARQIETIRQQIHDNWIVIISDDSSTKAGRDVIRRAIGDDPRFYYSKNESRLGFYRNFEAAIARSPADADFIALSDQDDAWHDDKLSALLEAIGDRSLAFSDCRIVDQNDKVLADTFWTYRQNSYNDLTKMFLANSVTGAATLFRADMVEQVVPFPPPIGGSVHDQWLGLVALVKGGISYVDRPLYDYIQHGNNAIGHIYTRPFPGIGTAAKRLYGAYRARTGTLTTGNVILHEAWNEFPKLVQKVAWAQTIDLRIANMRPQDRKIVNGMKRYYVGLSESVRQKFGSMVSKRWTMNVEGYLLWSALGVRLRNTYYRWRGSAIVKASAQARQKALFNPMAPSEPASSGSVVGGDSPVHWIFHNIKPLKLSISSENPKRINIILATIDFKYIFGGYLGMFNLALRLRREGFEVRLILTEMTDFDPDRWVEELKKYPGVTSLLDDVEVIYCFDRSHEVPVSPEDKFVATNCWAAHLAHEAHKELGAGRFMFMVQEYEPYFLPMNSISALFQQSYTFPQFDLYSTPHLRDFFAQEKIGIFAHPDAEQHHAVFSNAIQKFTPRYEDMIGRERRILFYARPEAHAARNMFELGVKALVELANSDDVDLKGWKFYGMGSLGGTRSLPLAPGIDLELMPKTDLQTYIARMTQHDVGLSLMLTPHPSLVPQEMASAGMWTVTNTFANKTADSLTSISSNIIAAAPTLESIVESLKLAVSKVDDYEARLAGAKVNWPSNWDDAFPKESIDKVVDFLRQS